MDTRGKGGTIKHVFGGVNPQGCRIFSFKAPSAEEANHDFLWRYHKSASAKGRIGIFNRSHHEDVLVVRVRDIGPEEVWRERYGLINEFERNLTRNGITVLKFFLHISKGRAEAPPRIPPRRPGQALEVLQERHQGARLLGRLPGRFRGRRKRVLHQLPSPGTSCPPTSGGTAPEDVARTIADTLEAMDPRSPRPNRVWRTSRYRTSPGLPGPHGRGSVRPRLRRPGAVSRRRITRAVSSPSRPACASSGPPRGRPRTSRRPRRGCGR